MAIFKCKICGGSLEIDSSQSVATCEYCGTKQTLPNLDDERRANLYDRANHFRRNNDFDKAMGIYENILNEDTADAEAYWSIVLCRYGIEYVEDPGTRKRVPTVNRAQFTSIFDDEDYKSAIANADGYQREIYEAEAAAINEIQKGILAISQKEEPFDVFVCYKETDNNGRRTQDSVLATELYHELTREGFKVFFSRITLEDKLGTAYEPYIFAALHSAKVMVVLGTRPEHFNAVWVKNEWSRYLALIKNGAKKTLIPAYRDMNPYDLPEEFSHLQAQDMSKLGFMQDLTRGIKKIVEADAPKATVKETIVATAATVNVSPLLKRAFMFLEDGDFDRADDFCEQVLNQDPENAQAYVGKLMAELHVKRQNDLTNQAEPFDNNKNYQKAVRFADSTLAAELKGYIATIKERKARIAEEKRKESLYNGAMDDYKSADVSRIQNAIKVFASLAGYKDSDDRIRLCQAKIDQIHIKEENDRIERERLAEQKRIADEQARLEKLRRDEQRKIESEKRAKKAKRTIKVISIGIGGIVACFILLVVGVIVYLNVTNEPIDNDFVSRNNYSLHGLTYYVPENWVYSEDESDDNELWYTRHDNWGEFWGAMAVSYEGEFPNVTVDSVVEEFKNECSDAKSVTKNINGQDFTVVTFEMDSSDATPFFYNIYVTEEDQSVFYISFIFVKESNKTAVFNEIVGTVAFDDYVNPKEDIYIEANNLMSARKYNEAISIFAELGEYKDSATKITECENAITESNYAEASKLMANGEYQNAYNILVSLGDFRNSKELVNECISAVFDENIAQLISDEKYIEAYSLLVSSGNKELMKHFKIVYTKSSYSDKYYKSDSVYTYDEDGNLLKEIETFEDGDKEIKEYTYDSHNRLIKKRSTKSNKPTYFFEETYEYDIITGKMIKEITTYDLGGGTTGSYTYEYEYDSNGNMIKEIYTKSGEFGETVTKYEYNSIGQVTKELFHDGTYNYYEYGFNNELLKEVYVWSDGHESFDSYQYDDNGRLIKEIDSYGNSIEYLYNANYCLIKMVEYDDNQIDSTTEYEGYIVFYNFEGFDN